MFHAVMTKFSKEYDIFQEVKNAFNYFIIFLFH